MWLFCLFSNFMLSQVSNCSKLFHLQSATGQSIIGRSCFSSELSIIRWKWWACLNPNNPYSNNLVHSPLRERFGIGLLVKYQHGPQLASRRIDGAWNDIRKPSLVGWTDRKQQRPLRSFSIQSATTNCYRTRSNNAPYGSSKTPNNKQGHRGRTSGQQSSFEWAY